MSKPAWSFRGNARPAEPEYTGPSRWELFLRGLEMTALDVDVLLANDRELRTKTAQQICSWINVHRWHCWIPEEILAATGQTLSVNGPWETRGRRVKIARTEVRRSA